MKIGILTYHSSHNYGAFLQAYALCRVLQEQIEHDVEIINFAMRKSERVNKEIIFFNKRHVSSLLFNSIRFCMFEKATRDYHALSGKRMNTDELDKFSLWLNESYDIIIVGSDEVWKLDGYRGFPNPYWLPSIEGCKKMAYAVSSRTEPDKITPQMHNQLTDLLKSFSYVGVRDNVTKKLIDCALPSGQSSNLNCDPTFAYDFDSSENNGKLLLAHKYGVSGKKKCIALMIGVPELAYEIIKKYGNRYDFVSLYDYYGGTKGFYVPDPFEWIEIIASVDGLITTFYHGMVFAIKNNTPFFAIENRDITSLEYSKSYDLLKRNDLEKHFAVLQNVKDITSKEIGNFLNAVSTGEVENRFEKACEQEKSLFQSFLFEFI